MTNSNSDDQDQTKQATFGSDGSVEVESDDQDDQNDSDTMTRDDGKELDEYETCGGYNRYEVSSVFQKAVRRSDREKAMWAAWELARSGYGWNYWDRVQTVMLEDLRLHQEEAHIPAAIYNLMQLAKNKWSMDDGMGIAAAMRAASILAEAESSHELFFMWGAWKESQKRRLEAMNNDEDPNEVDDKHPIAPPGEDYGDLNYQVLDMHTRSGKIRNRNAAHFMIEASRTSTMTDLGKDYKEWKMREVRDFDFEEDQIDNALEPTGTGRGQWEGNKVGFPTDSGDDDDDE